MKNLDGFNTPILLIIFNRPENTREVFEVIRKIRPKHLYVAADGPRNNVEGEAAICREAREVSARVDWECKVNTLYRETNLGCKKAVSEGISWFFAHEEEGIILEDDCVPNATFFGFCERLLYRYRNDKRIMMIAGTNYLQEDVMGSTGVSYFFSNYYPIWGWATWKRAWELYDVDMKYWDHFQKSLEMEYLFSNRAISSYYQSMFNLIGKGFNTWDIQWWYACIFNHGLAIIPKLNLISNNGSTGTHMNTQGNLYINMPTSDINYENLTHPVYVFPDKHLNELTFMNSHAQIVLYPTLIQRLNNKIKSFLSKTKRK